MARCFKTIFFLFLIMPFFTASAQIKIYVSPSGHDQAIGNNEHPVASFERAQQLARQTNPSSSVQVIFKKGIYYLPNTILFTEKDNKINNATITYCAEQEGSAIISGGAELKTNWKLYKNGIYVTEVKANAKIDQLYINGERQNMARYPNAQVGKNVFDAWDLNHEAKFDSLADVLLPSRVANWKHPEGGFIHAMHAYLWGDMHWRITGKDEKNKLLLEGGWQNNRPSAMHPVFRMAENIFEELDAPGEWFLNEKTHQLFYYPKNEATLSTAKVEIVRLTHLIELNGSITKPVSQIHLKGFVFRHTARSFMENKDPLLRSDWTVYRGGAIVFNGAENCSIKKCEFDQVGGNTILVNHYNKKLSFVGCYIHHSGASGIVFVGDTLAVRNRLVGYGNQNYEGLDLNKGPQNQNFPSDCLIEDCLITMTGRVEKQTAPIQISIAHKIHINHCSIYDVPRAGINISEGAFGGHIIENSDIFNTVLETGDHGSFNSWGRDRYWSPSQNTVNTKVQENKSLPFLDMLDINIIRHNRWRCDHGWDIDLDDGSSQYLLYNNLLLNGGLKFREGYHRTASNNIIVNNSFHPHVWYPESGDQFTKNILTGTYKEIQMDNTVGKNKKWGKYIDANFFVGDSNENHLFINNGCDSISMIGDPQFKNPALGDFTVQNKLALSKLGFVNFDMQHFGVTSPSLKRITKKPIMPMVDIKQGSNKKETNNASWMGAQILEPKGTDLSAYGVGFNLGGVAIGNIDKSSPLHQLGLKAGDYIIEINGAKITSIKMMQSYLSPYQSFIQDFDFTVIRAQKKTAIHFRIKLDGLEIK